MLKTPVSYYGGKQKLLSTILPMIPEHRIYTEPFCGGAAVFWAKERSQMEVINDANREVINFYRVLQGQYDALWALVEQTLHSRAEHEDAGVMYRHPHLFTDVQRAWAFWVQTNMSFSSKILGGFAYGIGGNSCEKKTGNAKERFREVYSDRLKNIQIECGDALKVMLSRDCPDAFHYVDPPYPETVQGHYSGYTMDHFRSLLVTLASLEGKFLLSCYPNDVLDEFAQRFGWYQIRKEQRITAAGAAKVGKMKIEVLTANFAM